MENGKGEWKMEKENGKCKRRMKNGKGEWKILCYDLPSSYARQHSVQAQILLYTAAQLVLLFFLFLSVLAVFGLNPL